MFKKGLFFVTAALIFSNTAMPISAQAQINIDQKKTVVENIKKSLSLATAGKEKAALNARLAKANADLAKAESDANKS